MQVVTILLENHLIYLFTNNFLFLCLVCPGFLGKCEKIIKNIAGTARKTKRANLSSFPHFFLFCEDLSDVPVYDTDSMDGPIIDLFTHVPKTKLQTVIDAVLLLIEDEQRNGMLHKN